MGVNSLPKTITLQHRGCDLNPGPSAPASSTLTTRLLNNQEDLKIEAARRSQNTRKSLSDRRSKGLNPSPSPPVLRLTGASAALADVRRMLPGKIGGGVDFFLVANCKDYGCARNSASAF